VERSATGRRLSLAGLSRESITSDQSAHATKRDCAGIILVPSRVR